MLYTFTPPNTLLRVIQKLRLHIGHGTKEERTKESLDPPSGASSSSNSPEQDRVLFTRKPCSLDWLAFLRFMYGTKFPSEAVGALMNGYRL